MGENKKLIYDVDEDEFEEMVIEKSKEIPVIVDFWSERCMPCRMLSPILDRVVERLNGKVVLVKIDVDKNIDLAVKYDIMSIPTVMMFKNGEIVDYFVGFFPEEEVIKWVEKNLR